MVEHSVGLETQEVRDRKGQEQDNPKDLPAFNYLISFS